MKEIKNEERNYCVYMHTSPSGKRYIGITCQQVKKRWSNGKGYRKQVFYNAIKKYGWDNFKHEILFEKLTKNEAEEKERELISYYKSNQRDNGYNIDFGGTSIGRFSDSTKKKLSDLMIGENNHFYGKHHSDETKKRLSESHKGLESKLKGVPKTDEAKRKMSESAKNRLANPENHPLYGIGHTEETKKKMSESHKGLKQSEEHRRHNGESHKKPVIQFSKSGEFIKRYDSATDASIEIGGFSTSITACCKGRLQSAYGYIWKYESDVEIFQKVI